MIYSYQPTSLVVYKIRGRSIMKKSLFFMFVLLVLVSTLSACSNGSASMKATALPTEEPASTEAPNKGDAKESAIANGLTIPLSSLSAEPLFVDWEQDNTPMQLIALLDGNQVRLAYNTCQSCAGSPYAYFEYADGLLTCQNCGNQFGLDSVGAVVGGCNPLPVNEAFVEGDSVVIPISELKSNASAFANWRQFQ